MNPLIFSAPWCAACAALKGSLKEAGIPFDEVNVDSDVGSELARKYGVRGLPTTIFTDKEGNAVKTIVGLQPTKEYVSDHNS